MRVYLALLTTVVLWASAFVAIRAALGELGPGELAFLRYAVASVVMVGLVALTRPSLPPRGAWPRIIGLGLTGIAGYNLALNLGEQTVTAGAASLLAATNPLITGLLAVVLLGERLAPRLIVGLGLGFAGAALIAIGDGSALTIDPGALLVLVSAAALATYFVLQKPLLADHGPLVITACAIWVGTLTLMPFAGSAVAAIGRTSPGTLAAAAYLGVFPAAVAYALWAYVLSQMPASRAANYLYGAPVAALVIAWLWLHEVPTPLVIGGGSLALVGVLIGTSHAGTQRGWPLRWAPARGRSDSAEPAREPVQAARRP